MHYLKEIKEFIARKSEKGEILPLSSIIVVRGQEESELLGYRVRLVREKAHGRKRDSLGINVDDPLETEFVDLSREYGKLNFETHSPGQGCDVITYFLDPYAPAFRLTRDPSSGTREYIAAIPNGADVELAQWTSDPRQATVFKRLNYSLVYDMLRTLRASNAGRRFTFGREDL